MDIYRGPFLIIVIAFVLLEAAYTLFIRHQTYDWKASAASFGVALGNLLLRPLTGGLFLLVFPYVASFAPWTFTVSSPWTWIAGFLCVEFVYYWHHRFAHTVRWFWASHSVHHTANSFTLPAAIRLSWTNVLSGEWVMYLPLLLIGFPPVVVGGLISLNLIYQFFLHTEVSPRWGMLEYVLNTPAHHRIHHASNAAYIDRNFGGVLIVFDRLFGTFAKDDGHEAVRFGLTRPVTSNNPLVISLNEWARMASDLTKVRRPSEIWQTLFGRPQ
ncbi:sterol desaturase family protein [Asticcacaulis sp. ZE23SCel15]|uniref:sterol desaturase family protein n=1 Tax=Asticcacaulis sp. ZE23SCel15 TaxID=3059027 RepID=UPI00265E4BC5|nr:sterol desaturase family protein [Asticcacaulis sp. ZE23SCel15]WKL56695.1 sterol desaturase family protein [Asticcacaulis sp. ZE23SCel15]